MADKIQHGSDKTNRLFPRESAELISSKSKDVSVCVEGVTKAADVIFGSLKEKKYSFKIWKEHELHPQVMTESTVDWIFVLDSLNFSFWTENSEPWIVNYNGKNYTGYWALCAGIHRALTVWFYVLYHITILYHFMHRYVMPLGGEVGQGCGFDIFRKILSKSTPWGQNLLSKNIKFPTLEQTYLVKYSTCTMQD